MYQRIRLVISIAFTIVLSAVMLWSLVSVFEPQATLKNLRLRNVNKNHSTVYFELQITNRNYFRGFNYSEPGLVELYNISNSNNKSWAYMNFSDTQGNVTQRFRTTLNWNFSVDITTEQSKSLMKTQECHIYVSLVLIYWYEILFYPTKTFCYQWLDAHAYLNDSFDLKGDVQFNRIHDFTLVLQTLFAL